MPPTERSELLTHLGATVRRLRKARGWSRRELAAAAGVSERFLADIESGAGNPSVLRVAEVATALGTTPDALLAVPLDPRRRTIALLGLRGAGKSSVGPRLAAALGRPFVELDRLIEETAGMSLDDVFQMHGEDYYRRLEHAVLREVLERRDPCVLATGGGVVTNKPSFELLQQRARTVWLHAAPEDHWQRVVAQGDTRPMAGNDQAFKDLCAILEEREPLYAKADVEVATSGRSLDEITEELAARLAG